MSPQTAPLANQPTAGYHSRKHRKRITAGHRVRRQPVVDQLGVPIMRHASHRFLPGRTSSSG